MDDIHRTISGSVKCKIYDLVGGHDVLIHVHNVNLLVDSFVFNDARYVVDKTKVFYDRHWLNRGLVAVLEYDKGVATPRDRRAKDFASYIKAADGVKLARVASKYGWKNVYPSNEGMLMMIVMVAVVGLMISVGINGYVLLDPEGAENLRNIISNRGNTTTSERVTNVPTGEPDAPPRLPQ